MVNTRKFNKIRLSTKPDEAALRALKLGDIVYLDGIVYTGREGVYKKVIEEGVALPLDLPGDSAANFHCSPAAAPLDEGGYALSAVTATASFRFSSWLSDWFRISGAKLILGRVVIERQIIVHRLQHLSGIGETLGRILFQRFQNQCIEAVIDFSIALGRWFNLVVGNGVEHLVDVFAAKRGLPA